MAKPTLPEPGEFCATEMTRDVLGTMLVKSVTCGSGMLPMPDATDGDSLSVFVLEAEMIDDTKMMLLISPHLMGDVMLGAMRYVMNENSDERNQDNEASSD